MKKVLSSLMIVTGESLKESQRRMDELVDLLASDAELWVRFNEAVRQRRAVKRAEEEKE